MTTQNSGMKIPVRPAPALPLDKKLSSDRPESSQCDPFSPQKLKNIRKKPPPRPPPPRLNQTNQSRSIFGSSKRNAKKGAATAIVKPLPPSLPRTVIPTGTLIDLSPPNSPKLGKYNNENIWSSVTSVRNSSQLESGFEDDFCSVLSSGTTTPTISDPWSDFSPSPEPLPTSKSLPATASGSRPTIICMPRIKPARPPPPPSLDDCSPPMPSVPPPPPPPEVLQVLANGPALPPRPVSPYKAPDGNQSFCIAVYDYESSHPDDLQFKTSDRISIVSNEGEEWLRGRLKGREGIFPRSYVRCFSEPSNKPLMWVIALFPFTAESWDDLELKEGDKVKVLDRVNDDWLYGEISGRRGLFPESFVQDVTELEAEDS